MPPNEPQAPAGPDWDLLKKKKPTLSMEHIENIAELSATYLESDAVEFSEDDLLSNLYLLWQMSKAPKAKMSKKHAKQIEKIVISAFAKHLHPITEAPANKSQAQSMMQLRSSADMLQQSDQIIKSTRIDEKIRKLGREAAIAKLYDNALSHASKLKNDNQYNDEKSNAAYLIAAGLQEAGMPIEALKTAAKINQDLSPPYPLDVVRLYSQIGVGMAKAGDDPHEAFDKAMRALERLSDLTTDRNKGLVQISTCQAKSGFFDDAMVTTSKIGRVPQKAEAYCNIALEMKEAALTPWWRLRKPTTRQKSQSRRSRQSCTSLHEARSTRTRYGR